MRSTLLFDRSRLRVCVETRNTKNGDQAALERQPSSARSSGPGKRLNPVLKSWMDNVIIPQTTVPKILKRYHRKVEPVGLLYQLPEIVNVAEPWI